MSALVALILGGGAGSRLYPLTEVRSKPAVPIGGKYRLIDIPISNCLNAGVRRMFVLTQFNSASLNQHIKNTYNFDVFSRGFVDILAAEQTPTRREWFQGTADAVRQSLHHLVNHPSDHALILSGDQLYQMDFRALLDNHRASGAELTIATIPVIARDAPGFGIMKVGGDGFIERFIEKPAPELLPEWASEVSDERRRSGRVYLASMGIYLFDRALLGQLLDERPEATDFGKEIIPHAIQSGRRVASYAFDGYWTDIGTIGSFFEANIALADPIPAFNLFDNERAIYTRTRQLPPSKISGTHIQRAVVAEGCIIGAKRIENAVVGIRSRIGEACEISNAVILGNDYFETLDQIARERIPMGIGAGCRIDHAIIDKDAHIGRNVHILGGTGLPDQDAEEYCIRDGIVVVRKGAVIGDGARIGRGT